jgi:hypothetical protein
MCDYVVCINRPALKVRARSSKRKQKKTHKNIDDPGVLTLGTVQFRSFLGREGGSVTTERGGASLIYATKQRPAFTNSVRANLWRARLGSNGSQERTQ